MGMWRSEELVSNVISSAASISNMSATSMFIPPALAFNVISPFPVPAATVIYSRALPPAPPISRSFAAPVTVKFESSVPSIEIPAEESIDRLL